MRTCLLLLLLASLSTNLFAQAPLDSDEAAVSKVIDQIFDGMRNADSAAVGALLHLDIRMQSTGYDQNGEPYLAASGADRWLQSIAKYEAGSLDERLYSRVIEVDPPLATAWTEYSFFLNGKLSHCGTNAFQLNKTTEGWKVHQVTDTRRQENCTTEERSLADTLHAFIDNWHQAAAKADEDTFFGSMAADGIYLGTDASERWLRDTFQVWAKAPFDRESAWDFKPYQRELYFSDNNKYVWWEELLETWMGPCRGSGVARFYEGRWQIQHYNLALTIPNEKMKAVIEVTKDE
ncbi:MAG: nuclear transport factor 2 family protein [Bacteroidota bacterium]